MSITLEKTWLDFEFTSGTALDQKSATVTFVLITDNDEDEEDIETYCQDNLPADFLNGLLLSDFTVRRADEDIYHVAAEYEPTTKANTVQALEVDGVRYSVRGGSGGTKKRTFSDQLVNEYAPGFPEYRFQGTNAETVMGLVKKPDGFEVQGIDEDTGQVTLSIDTVKSHTQVITDGYLVTLAEYAAKKVVNNAAYAGFAAGTLKLVDFAADPRGGDDPDWDIQLVVEFAANRDDITIGDITGIDAEGHDEIEVLYIREVINNLPLSRPARVAVHRTRERIDFAADLGI